MDHTSKHSPETVLVPLRCDSLNGTVKNDNKIPRSKSSHDNSDSENRIESGVMSKDIVAISNNILTDVTNTEDGDGSEAETVVLPGKNSDTISSKKTIRHEGNGINVANGDGIGGGQKNATSTAQTVSSTKISKPKSQLQEGSVSSDKKSDKNNGISNSSHDSPSATSSSVSLHDNQQDQRQNSRSRATSESAKSKQDNTSLSKPSSTTVPRKRKGSMDGNEDKSVKRRIKREDNDSAAMTDSKKSITLRRSESPSRQRTSTGSSNSPSVTKPRRKAPPPLVVGPGGRRKQSVDGDSNESQSPKHSAHPKLTHAADSEMLKKRRDKNGRTRVARACAANNIEDVKECLKEHPEELDEPDNAGNTPLQIASLEGSTDIVRLLLKKGCKVDTENVDKDSPLIDSVENSHLAVVRLLLEAGVNPRKLNSKGEEPSELVDPDHPNGAAIKEELIKYRIKYDSKRRQSTEKGPDTGTGSLSTKSPRGSPSLNARSPPPQTTRRRAGRSEATRNDLLWITATPENLVNFACKGDDQAIMHLLNMRPVSDVEAVLAAAKGGHDSCLNLLLAMGTTDPDPAPLEEHKKGANTPMLAAIGKNNLRVIELLLEQPGFDPTRRLYKNKTYYEIAEQRGGDGWREEYRRLKTAYDEKTKREGKKTSAKSSRTSSPKDLKKSQKDPSPSAIVVRESSPSSKTGIPRTKAASESKPEKVRERTKDQESDGRPDRKHLKVPKRESREGSNAVSDREASPMGDREKRSASDQEALPRPRKRLISGRDIKQAQRRNSLVSTVSTSSAPDSVKTKSSPDESTKVRRLEVDEKKEKKRLRKSVSPQPSEPPKSAGSVTKRPRMNSDAAPPKSNTGTAITRTSQPTNTAPVALMASSSSSEKKDAKTSSKSHSSATSTKERTIKLDSEERPKMRTKDRSKPEQPTSDADKRKTKDSKAHSDQPRLAEIPEIAKENLEPVSTNQIKQENIESPTKESPADVGAKIVSSPLISPRNTTIENSIEITTTTEIAAIPDTLTVDVQPASTETTADEIANEKKRARDQEELAEEAERHKRRREDEEVSRKRAAQEEKQRQERKEYLEALPRVFRDLLENPEQAKLPQELQTWSALRCVRGSEIDPDCPEIEREELWVTNFQVAAILVESDLEMSHYTSWTRKPLVDPVKNIVWRVLRSTIHRWSMYDSNDVLHGDHIAESYDASLICEKKFLALKTFWIKLSDFEGVISRYPHLQTFKYDLRTIPRVETYKKIEEQIEEREKSTPSTSAWSNLTPRPTQSPDQPTDPSFPRK